MNYNWNANHKPDGSNAGGIIISQSHKPDGSNAGGMIISQPFNSYLKKDKYPDIFQYGIPNNSPVRLGTQIGIVNEDGWLD